VLNRRVALHAIDAMPARWRGDAGSSPFDRRFSSIMHRLHLLPRDDEAAAEKALAQMFDVADIDHSGTVSFDEFCAMFHQHVGGADPPKPRGHATQEVTAAFAAK
jgi:hypothetical protein